MQESQHGVELIRVSREYTRGGEGVKVFDDVDLSVKPGAFCAMMGPSGSGKSTLLNLLFRLGPLKGVAPSSGGAVIIDGVDTFAEYSSSSSSGNDSPAVGINSGDYVAVRIDRAGANTLYGTPLGRTELTRFHRIHGASFARGV